MGFLSGRKQPITTVAEGARIWFSRRIVNYLIGSGAFAEVGLDLSLSLSALLSMLLLRCGDQRRMFASTRSDDSSGYLSSAGSRSFDMMDIAGDWVL